MLKWLTLAFAVLLASSLLSMMAVFSGSTGGDLSDLLNLQTVSVPVAVAATTWSYALSARRHGAAGAPRRLWAELPGWLILAVAVMLSLVVVAELAFVLAGGYTGEARPWREHVPVATAFTSALALAACYAALRMERP
ncbi:MAG TPA: hypothetical protein VF200_06980 [Woeseiaceae bacterium]